MSECRYIDHEYLCEKEELDEEIARLQRQVEALHRLCNYILNATAEVTVTDMGNVIPCGWWAKIVQEAKDVFEAMHSEKSNPLVKELE